MPDDYDIAVIGAGPIGIACAVACQRRGLNTVLIDRGCLANALFHYPRTMTFFSTAERIEILGIPFPCPDPKPSREQALHYYRGIALQSDVSLRLYENVEHIHGEPDDFSVQTDKGKITCKRVILATGFFDHPVQLGIPGEDRKKCSHYFDDAHRYAGTRLIIVGGANSAVIAALECWRLGAEVTIIHRGKDFKPSVKYWLKPDIDNRIKEGSIAVRFEHQLTAVHDDHVEVTGPTGPLQLANDFVLFLTGYRSDYAFLDRCGIERDAKQAPLLTAQHESRSRPGLYLAGCICGGDETGKIFIENARDDAITIAEGLSAELGA